MCMYFSTKTDIAQNLNDEFFSNFYCQRTSLSIGRILSEKKYGSTGYFLKKWKFGVQNLMKERKQPPVVIL